MSNFIISDLQRQVIGATVDFSFSLCLLLGIVCVSYADVCVLVCQCGMRYVFGLACIAGIGSVAYLNDWRGNVRLTLTIFI